MASFGESLETLPPTNLLSRYMELLSEAWGYPVALDPRLATEVSIVDTGGGLIVRAVMNVPIDKREVIELLEEEE